MRKSKAFKLETILAERIKMGDYAFVRFPSERQLAQAFGVTQMTARRAVLNLESQGLLRRQENGTLCVDIAGNGKKGKLAILMPSYPSNFSFMCQQAVTREAQIAGWQCRSSLYLHWDDAILEESIKNFDGIFLIPVSEDIPEHVISMLKTSTPVVCLGGDMSEYGIPSLTMEPENLIVKLMNYLRGLKHDKIDFFNTQPRTATILRHIEEWKTYLKAKNLKGELFDLAVDSYGNSYEQAFLFINSSLQGGNLSSKCLLCSSISEATGASRALHNHGLRSGKDLALVSIGGGDITKRYIPSITSVDETDYSEGIRVCMEWMSSPSKSWDGELLLWGRKATLFIGESTEAKQGKKEL